MYGRIYGNKDNEESASQEGRKESSGKEGPGNQEGNQESGEEGACKEGSEEGREEGDQEVLGIPGMAERPRAHARDWTAIKNSTICTNAQTAISTHSAAVSFHSFSVQRSNIDGVPMM